MFSIRELHLNLIRVLKFNRFFLGVITFELMIYSSQIQEHPPFFGGLVNVIFFMVVIQFISNELIGKLMSHSQIFPRTYQSLTFISKIFIICHFVLITLFVMSVNDLQSFILYLIPLSFCLLLSIKEYTIPIILVGSTLYFIQSHFNIYTLLGFMERNAYHPSWLSYIIAMIATAYTLDLITRVGQTMSEKNFFYRSLATLDGLTGLINRRYLNKRLQEEFSRARRHKIKLTVAILDVDHFKMVNDTYGHTAGDMVLKEIASILKINTRTSDVVARYGGEEFMLILPETSQKDGFEILDRIRALIAKEVFKIENAEINVTISIGMAQLNYDASVAELVKRADKALYTAKHYGRNNVQVASRLVSMKVAGKS